MKQRKAKVTEEELKSLMKRDCMGIIVDLVGSGYVVGFYENEANQISSLVLSYMRQYKLVGKD